MGATAAYYPLLTDRLRATRGGFDSTASTRKGPSIDDYLDRICPDRACATVSDGLEGGTLMFDDFYGLEGRPFQLTPDPAFYFESLTHRKALSYLGYGLAQGEGFVVITGEVGAGKSTLVAHLMATIDPARLTAAQIVTSELDGEEIVHVVAQAFGLKVAGHDKASALGAIEAFLHDEARAGRRCLLIVDEAQNLSVDGARRTADAVELPARRASAAADAAARPAGISRHLAGQPAAGAIAPARDRHASPRARCSRAKCSLISNTACRASAGRAIPISTRAFSPTSTPATGGIPRRINQIVNRLLLLGAVDRRNRIEAAMLDQVLEELDAAMARVRWCSAARADAR